MTMRAVVYARVSSAAQRERQTIASQLRTLPDEIAARGWQLVRPADHYADDGLTAKAGHLEKRLGFQRLLADAAAGAFDVVMVVDLDRVTRSEDMIERGQIYGALQRAGVQVATPGTGALDLNTFAGETFVTLQAIVAAEENRKRRERTMRGRVEGARKGRKMCGPTLYGYVYNRETGAWSVDQDAAEVVRECFRRVAAGESCYRVGSELFDRGALRPRGGRWTGARVYRLVTNTGYTGAIVLSRGHGLTAQVPPLVDRSLFDLTQAMLPGSRRPRAPRSRAWSLLEGIAICGECGARIGIVGGGGRPRYYVCATRKLRPQDRVAPLCANRNRRVGPCDEAIWAQLCEVIARPDLFARALADRAPDDHNWEDELAGYERQLATLEQREVVILEAFRRGRVSAGAMEREQAAAQRQREMLERNRDVAAQGSTRARQRAGEADDLRASVADLRELVAHASAEDRQRIARRLVPGNGGLHVTLWRDRAEVLGRLPVRPGTAVTQASQASWIGERSGERLFRVVSR